MTEPVRTADSVRLALPAEAAAVALVQRRAWDDAGDVSWRATLLGAISLEEMARVWQQAITRPPDARCRVLVGLDGGLVVGFVTTLPCADPDADPSRDGAIEELTVDPTARFRGHGSRLLNAGVDTLRSDGFSRATCWVGSTDDVLRAFLSAAGWAPDGGRREIGSDDETVRIKQIRLHCAF